MLWFKGVGDFVPAGEHFFHRGLSKDRPERSGDDFGLAFRDRGEQVADVVDPAPLPARSLETGPDRLLQTLVSVGDHEADTCEAAFLERAEEGGPERGVFRVTNVNTEDLSAARSGDPGGDHDRS